MATGSGAVGRRFVQLADASARDVASPFGGTRTVHEYFGVADRVHPGPQAFPLQLPPDCTARAHFHRIDQFQILFGRPGAFYGQQPMAAVLLHYADAYSTYGPFGSGRDHPIEYFTLREQGDNLVAHMPEYRRLKLRKSGRNIHVAIDPNSFECITGQWSEDVVLFDQPDNLRASILRIAPRATAMAPGGHGGGGAYYCVIYGTGQADGQAISAKSLSWVPAGTEPPHLTAGKLGLVVAVMQFPNPRTVPVVADPWPEQYPDHDHFE